MSNCPTCHQPVREKTKHCPHCGSTELVELYSQSLKICNSCKKTHDWPLSEGQSPVFEGTKPDPEMCVAINVMWGHYDERGVWQHNPGLPMSREQQRAENIANGFPEVKS